MYQQGQTYPVACAQKQACDLNLLAQFLQVGDHAVAQAILHVVSQQVRGSHDSQGLPQGLRIKHR